MFNKARPIKNFTTLCKYICAESQIVVQVHKVDLDAEHLQQNLDWVHPTPQAGRHLLPLQPTCQDPVPASWSRPRHRAGWSFCKCGECCHSCALYPPHPCTIVNFPTLALAISEAEKLLEPKQGSSEWDGSWSFQTLSLLLMDRNSTPRIMMTTCPPLCSSQLLPKFRYLLWVSLVMCASWPNSVFLVILTYGLGLVSILLYALVVISS